VLPTPRGAAHRKDGFRGRSKDSARWRSVLRGSPGSPTRVPGWLCLSRVYLHGGGWRGVRGFRGRPLPPLRGRSYIGNRAGVLRDLGPYNSLGCALSRWRQSAAFALRPLRVARDLKRCDHDYSSCGGHTSDSSVTKLPVLGSPASLIGSEFPQSTWLRPFALPHPYAARLSYVH
jgi:hypothetical protein